MRKNNKIYFLIAGLIFTSANVFAQGGALKGHVAFEGTPPVVEKIEVKSDTPICGTHQEVPKLILGKDQGVANAVVRILGATGTLEPKKGHLDQKGCQFIPHVQVISTGSTLVITSSDAVLHNTHAFREDGSTAFNIAVPIVGMEVNKKLTKPGVLKLRCDAGHTWMSGYVVVVDEPFFAVTDTDGNFSIEGIPPGQYDVEIWQEWVGKNTQKVEIKDGSNELKLTIKKSI